MITRLLCIVTLHVAASADGGPGTDWLTVSVSAAADPDLASRYSRAEVTEVTRIYEEDNTNTATARPLAHTAATLFLPYWHRVKLLHSSCHTDTVSTVCLVPLTPLFSEHQSPALFAPITIYSVIFTSCPTKSLRILHLLFVRKETIFIVYIFVFRRHY